MATYNKSDQFVEDICFGVYDFTNTAAAVPTIALTTNAQMPIAADAVLASITEIAYTNLSSRAVLIAGATQTTGTFQLDFTDHVLTATGAVATFRGVAHYADVPTSPADPLIQWYDHGSDVTLANGETYTLDYAASGFFQLA